MSDHDEVKKRFKDQLKASMAESQGLEAGEAAEAEAALKPIIERASAMSEAIHELEDTIFSIRIQNIDRDRDGFYVIKISFNSEKGPRNIQVRYGPAFGSGNIFWVTGLGDKARKNLERSSSNTDHTSIARSVVAEFGVDRDRSEQIADEIEKFGLEYFSS